MAFEEYMSKQKFKVIDLLFLSGLAIITEVAFTIAFNIASVKSGNYTFGQILTLSFAPLIGMIAIYRWNQYGLIVAPIGGIASLITRVLLKQQLTIQLWLYYSLAYLALAVCYLFIRKKDKSKFRKDKGMMILYFFIGYLSLEVIRMVVLIGSENYLKLSMNFLMYDLINIFISFVIYLVTLRQDGLVVDMNQYLIQMQDIQKRIEKESVCMEELAEGNQINEAALLDGGTLSTEDLKKMEDDRRRIEGLHSSFDDENNAINAYKKKREALKHGKK